MFLASASYAADYARRRGLPMSKLARIDGWGHRTAPMRFTTKLAQGAETPYVLPQVNLCIRDAFSRAGILNIGGSTTTIAAFVVSQA